MLKDWKIAVWTYFNLYKMFVREDNKTLFPMWQQVNLTRTMKQELNLDWRFYAWVVIQETWNKFEWRFKIIDTRDGQVIEWLSDVPLNFKSDLDFPWGNIPRAGEFIKKAA